MLQFRFKISITSWYRLFYKPLALQYMNLIFYNLCARCTCLDTLVWRPNKMAAVTNECWRYHKTANQISTVCAIIGCHVIGHDVNEMTAVTNQCWRHHCWQNGNHDVTGWYVTEKFWRHWKCWRQRPILWRHRPKCRLWFAPYTVLLILLFTFLILHSYNQWSN